MICRVVAIVIATGLLLAGCGAGSRASLPTRAASAPAEPSIRCGSAPAAGRALTVSGSGSVRLPGVPDGIASSLDGRVAFVALQSGGPRIAVITQRAGGGYRLLRMILVPAYASGVRVTPDGRFVLAAAGGGLIVLAARAAVSGAGQALVGLLSAPAGVAGTGPGAAEVAVSPDSRYAFVTLEGAGVVAVFRIAGSSRYVGAIPVGAGALGLAVSPNGRWLYEVSESARARARGRSSERRGVLNVIDIGLAVRRPRGAVIATVPAPCAPVRVAVSPDGAHVWVTARDGNALLGFSASALQAHPGRALVSVTHVGPQPLGVAVVNGGRTVLVADSKLSRSGSGHAGVSVIDTPAGSRPRLAGTIATGSLADAIAAPGPGGAALVTVSGTHRVVAIPTEGLP